LNALRLIAPMVVLVVVVMMMVVAAVTAAAVVTTTALTLREMSIRYATEDLHDP